LSASAGEQQHWQQAASATHQTIALAGDWRYVIEHEFGPISDSGIPGLLPNAGSPHALYDNLVAPLVPFGLCGVLWYQGESNAAQPMEYRTRFRMMIRDWRRAWGRELPFLFVQLAGYLPAKSPGFIPDWPRLREAQALALAEPKTAMAVAIDIGNAVDIHPINKLDVGKRLALAAEKLVYGRAVVACGPAFESMTVRGQQARVRFAHSDGGLVAASLFDATGFPVPGATPTDAKTELAVTGFEIAGADREFHSADATIDGDSAVVSSPKVAKPVAVRYAWGDCPACNLYNLAKPPLPAAPFRTDEW
jgi:sialate O-acetylesterase